MELKQHSRVDEVNHRTLLIVPYGIETFIYQLAGFSCNKLLIVPYGIETTITQTTCKISFLLIVPYGIETRSTTVNSKQSGSFNRTLWN